jgi:hypothetical protein
MPYKTPASIEFQSELGKDRSRRSANVCCTFDVSPALDQAAKVRFSQVRGNPGLWASVLNRCAVCHFATSMVNHFW